MPRPNLPDGYFEITDGNLGIINPTGDGIHFLIGVATTGTVNEVVACSTPQQVVAEFTSGPLVESALVKLALGCPQVYCMRSAASVAGTIGAVTPTVTGTGTVALAGPPQDSALVEIRITQPGAALGSGAFIFSLDGGLTFSSEKAIPSGGTYVLGMGITATFAVPAGAGFAVGDKYTATATAPQMNTSDITAALDAMLASQYEAEAVHIVGGASAAVAAVVDTKMTTAEANHIYMHAIVETVLPSAGQTLAQWKTAVMADYANFTSKRVSVVAAYGLVVSQKDGRQVVRNLGSHYVGWLMTTATVNESAGKVIRGGVPGIISLGHDEFKSGGLDPKQFVTFRTYKGRRGFYVTNARVMAGLDSDYQFAELRRTMDKACRLLRIAQLRWIHETVRVDGQTGNLDKRDAAAISAHLQSPIDQMEAAGEISDSVLILDPNQNVLSTSEIVTDLQIIPTGTIRWLKTRVGFKNPKLEVNA